RRDGPGAGDAPDLGVGAAPAAPALVDGGPMNDLVARINLTRGAFHLDVHLEVAAGEVVALLGPNGAGKTTLVRALAGLETGQDVRVGGVALPARVERRGVGVVFSDLRLSPHLSVRDNIAFGCDRPGPWLDALDL